MKVLVLAEDNDWNELAAISGVEWLRAADEHSIEKEKDIDIYINLSAEIISADYTSFKKPVLINSVSSTLKKLQASSNVIRINGWTGFLSRPIWEVSGQLTNAHISFLKSIQKEFIEVPDEPGFISARIISMIINEAYFAKSEGVSSEKEIDIAMKLGTNYPYGPFEWATKIGLEKVHDLLHTLSQNDPRYSPCPLLVQEISKPA